MVLPGSRGRRSERSTVGPPGQQGAPQLQWCGWSSGTAGGAVAGGVRVFLRGGRGRGARGRCGMRRADSRLCPDPPREGSGARSPPSSLFLSFFEQECRDIVARLRQAAEPSLVPGDRSALWLESAGFVTSTPLPDSPPGNDAAPDAAAAAARPRSPGPEAAAAPTPARGSPRCLPPRAAGSRPARPQALPRTTAQRGAAQQLCGRQGPAARTPRRGGRQSLSQARASLVLQLPKAGKGLGAPGSNLPQPAGTKLRPVPEAKSRLQHASRAPWPPQPPGAPKAAPRDKGTEGGARAGARRQPSRRLSTAVPTVASRSRLRPLGKAASPKRFHGSTTQEQLCNRTQELRKDDESKEWLVGTVSGAGKADQTWVYGESSLCSEMPPGPAPGGEDAVSSEQSAGDQLSQELKHVKSELERVKGELAAKTAQCEAYRQMICSLQARLRAAGICLEDAEVEESGDSGRASQQHMGTEP
ncbi:collagen alpha-1(I) chain-like [Pezoporus flaviventris]|uniref:collagen alpha-1(I) chain-like n=1 Tax=Pezoporus flaviventris TaxID=889875 RepID=UPI002AAF5A84|nr:collagen alpha-1(I) chain-like [Pezoporus flaviventris]